MLDIFERNIFREFPNIERFLKGRRGGQQIVKVACTSSKKKYNLQEFFAYIFRGVDVLLVSKEQYSRVGACFWQGPQSCRQWGRILILTSGTSGEPRIIVHSLEELLKSARTTLDFYEVDGQDVWPLSLPIYHIGGIQIALRCILAGVPLQNLDEGFYRKEVKLHGITLLSLVPTQWNELVSHSRYWDDIKKMKAILIGGASLNDKLWQEAIKEGFPLSPTYGMTEMGSQVAALRVEDFLQGKTGLEILPGREAKICEGKIILSGAGRMLGLFKGGFLVESESEIVTSDMGVWEEGRLKVFGRWDHAIISGGKKIYPQPLEFLLSRHSEIEEAVLVGVPDERWGERLHLVYTGGPNLRLEDVRKFLHSFAASWEMPKGISHCHSLPKKSGLKLDRREIAQFAQMSGE